MAMGLKRTKRIFHFLNIAPFHIAPYLENLFKKELQSVSGGNKAKYVLKRMFPPVSRFKYSNPFVYRHKIVYPFFLAYRMVANPIRHRRYLKSEIQAVKNTKN